MNDYYSKYKKANIDTADQGKLILIVYDVAINSCKKAFEIFDDKERIEERTKHLKKAQEAISELMSSLNMEAGEISNNLYNLYDYMTRRIIHSNAANDHAPIEEVVNLMSELREAWRVAADNVRKEGGSVSGQTEGVKGSISVSG